MRNALQKFMYGRYGGDQLSLFLLALYAPWKRKLQRIKNKYDLLLG